MPNPFEMMAQFVENIVNFGNQRACDNAHRACHALHDSEREVEALIRRLAHKGQQRPSG